MTKTSVRGLFRIGLWEGVALAALLLTALALRLAVSDHPIGLHGGDGYRDYVVADHVLRYGEFPTVGPNNAFLPGLGNSPFYFYLIAAFALVWNDPSFVQACFIGLYLLSIACVFYIARILFGRAPAYIAAGIIAIAPVAVYESAGFIWQPHAMEPFLTASVLALVVGWRARRGAFLIASQLLYVCAIALHMSALGLAPLYVPILYSVARGVGGGASALRLAAWGAGSLVIMFGANIAGAIGKAFSADATIAGYREIGLRGVEWSTFGRFLDAVVGRVLHPFSGAWALALLAAASAVYLRFVPAARIERRAFAALLLAITLQALLNLGALAFTGEVGERYLVPVGWSIAVVVGVLISALFLRKGIVLRLVGVCVLLGMLWGYAGDRNVRAAFGNILEFDRPRARSVEAATDAIVVEIERIRDVEARLDYRFFDFIGYRAGGYNVLSSVFYQSLERRLGMQFMENKPGNWLGGINGQEYVFVFCTKDNLLIGPYGERDCLLKFEEEKPSHFVERSVYNDRYLSVYLARDPLAVSQK